MRRQLESLLFAAALAVALTGCAGRSGIGWPDPDPSRPMPYVINGVPFFSQNVNQCGPAALAMALHWSGIPASPQDLSEKVFTPSRRGSLQPALVAAARRNGRIAYLLAEPKDLVAEVAAGHPVIVLQNLGLSWYPVWHYSVVIGWDAVGKEVILHSGVTPFRRTAFRTFERTWARGGYWGLLVLPPSDLPATAEESIYVAAASQLERLENWGVALQAYRSALTRWPDNLPAVVGIGVCLYRMGDLASAETHLRAAGKRFPQEGVVFNNLAQVLLEQGRRGEALQAATYALECGGPLKSHFEETLEEIHNYKPDTIDNPNEK